MCFYLFKKTPNIVEAFCCVYPLQMTKPFVDVYAVELWQAQWIWDLDSLHFHLSKRDAFRGQLIYPKIAIHLSHTF